MTSKAWTWRGDVTKSKLKPTTKHVLLTLSMHFNEYGEGAFPSFKTLAQRTGLNRATVIRHIQDAVQEGWLIKQTRRCKIKGNDTNYYIATIPHDVKIESDTLVAQDDHLVAESNHPSCTERLPLVAQDDPNIPSINIPDNIPKGLPETQNVSGCPFNELLSDWNNICGLAGCVRANKLSNSRKQSMGRRWKDELDQNRDNWIKFCKAVAESKFHTGANDRGWTANLDWALKPNNITKLLEQAAKPRKRKWYETEEEYAKDITAN